mmetsp:Transcript_28371/g.52028  ORF Transcript_28371/g.52028 Transcript_28371/m.52028 type:complete len:541 (-) Transcript_28371:31-1653(-)
MIDYRAGNWGFHVACGIQGSLAPRAFVMAIPNALLTFLIATLLLRASPDSDFLHEDTVDAAKVVIAGVTPIMIFILYNRSRTSYDRWWEGGTLLQKTRGEWFNAYSSIMAFTSTKPELQDQVDRYVHLLARLMSLLMCCGLQQVSPNRDRPFEIIGLDGIEPESMEFLNEAPDKVEIILQWIQRSMVLHQQTGVLPVAPPILSRAFQEVSRGIVNLQNARKIADFPYPYPLAQISMILQLLHWATTPIASAMALPLEFAVLFSFFTIFVLWCIHFNALDLEFPFGSRVNDLPMEEFQQDWNNSICTLVDKRATRPPFFDYEPDFHDGLLMAMSDASDLYIPKKLPSRSRAARRIAVIKVSSNNRKKSCDSTGEVPKGPDIDRLASPQASIKSLPPQLDSSTEVRKAHQLVVQPEKEQEPVRKNQQVQDSPALQSKEMTTPPKIHVFAKDDGLLETPATKASLEASTESPPGSSQASRSIQPTNAGIRAVEGQPTIRVEPQVLGTTMAEEASASGRSPCAADAPQTNDGDASLCSLNVKSI